LTLSMERQADLPERMVREGKSLQHLSSAHPTSTSDGLSLALTFQR
jgi:hypothetical protein